jgi:hypothetical protein
MKNAIFLVGIAALVASCSQPSSQPVAPNGTSVAECPPASNATATSYSPLPPEFAFATPFHVRADRIYTSPTGVPRRISTLEILAGNADTVAAEAGRAFVAMGFREVQTPSKGDGLTRLAFVKPKYGRINIYAQADVGDKPFNPAAVGLIKFDWPLAAPPAKAAEQAAPASVDSIAGGGGQAAAKNPSEKSPETSASDAPQY